MMSTACRSPSAVDCWPSRWDSKTVLQVFILFLPLRQQGRCSPLAQAWLTNASHGEKRCQVRTVARPQNTKRISVVRSFSGNSRPKTQRNWMRLWRKTIAGYCPRRSRYEIKRDDHFSFGGARQAHSSKKHWGKHDGKLIADWLVKLSRVIVQFINKVWKKCYFYIL